MTQSEAKEISEWHYGGLYSFYDMSHDPKDLEEFLDFKNWKRDVFFSTLDLSQELIGFFEFRRVSDAIHVGLGIRPDLTGKGLGKDFVTSGLLFAQDLFNVGKFIVSVAQFNLRAIRLYRKLGFIQTKAFLEITNGEVYPFFEMLLEITDSEVRNSM
jgi:ribosomal-protein-alanine N-acetyltransferase